MISIRTLHPQHEGGWETLRRVRNECRAFMTGDGGEITPERQDDYRRRFDPETQAAYLIEDPVSRAVGFLYLRRDGRRDGDEWLPTYGVIEEERGHGYGRFLVGMSQLLCPRLLLKVKVSNWIAQDLYKKTGFIAHDRDHENNIIMRWSR